MNTSFGVSDPCCLNLAEHELCQGDLPPHPGLKGGASFFWSPSVLPYFGLAALLHGAVFFLGLTLAMSARLPTTVISISLLAPCRTATGGSGPAPGSSVDVAEPASPSPTAEMPKKQSASMAEVKQRSSQVSHVPKKEGAKPTTPAPQPMAQEKGESAPASVADLALSTAGGAGREIGSGVVSSSAVQGRVASVQGSGGGGGGGAGPVSARFGDADGPRFVQKVVPKYPELARRRNREGRVLLRLVIGPQGQLEDAQVVEGCGHGFEEAALAAVKASIYAPAMRDGQGVESMAFLPIRFALKEK